MKTIKINILIGISDLLLIITSFLSSTALSEIILDGSMGTAGALAGPDYQITEDLGKLAGNNLFHSFGQFNLNSGEIATFSGSPGIQNVISRVTGGQSFIDGLFRSTIPGANMYFLNPAGVIFGENAILDVQGSFHISTADYLKFKDGVKFESGEAIASSVLTVAAPEAFGFLDNTPASIDILGKANNINQALDVPDGETFSLVGGNISIVNNGISVSDGQINIISVGSAGEAIIGSTEIETGSFKNMGDIYFESQNDSSETVASIFLNGDSAKKIFIQGGEMTLKNTSIVSETQEGMGGNIDINLSRGLNIDGIQNNSKDGIFTNTESFGTGGNIELNVGGINLAAGANIATITEKGTSGNITIKTTGNIKITGKNTAISSITNGAGKAGDLEINTKNLETFNGASISSHSSENSEHSATSGNIKIIATDTISLTGSGEESSGIYSATQGKGTTGNLTIHSDKLFIKNGGGIYTIATGEGNSGNVHVTSKNIKLTGIESNLTGIGTFSTGHAFGSSGDLNIDSHDLTVQNGASIHTSNGGLAKAGNLNIKSENILLSDQNSTIKTTTSIDSIGNAGDLRISANEIKINDGASLNTSTLGSGNGGNLVITADDIYLNNSSLKSDSQNMGSAGNINIVLKKGGLTLENDALITSAAKSAMPGNISIDDGKIIQLSGKSSIQTGAVGQRGGDVFISAPIVALDNSSIKAKDDGGTEGSVVIPGFLFKSPLSEVSATSRLDIKPDTTISGNIAILPESLIDTSQHLSDGCANRTSEKANSFVIKGRGNLPLSPGKLVPSTYTDFSPTTPPFQQSKNHHHHGFTNDSTLLSSNKIDCIF
jgi:filamentous hemagglutinin family protein